MRGEVEQVGSHAVPLLPVMQGPMVDHGQAVAVAPVDRKAIDVGKNLFR